MKSGDIGIPIDAGLDGMDGKAVKAFIRQHIKRVNKSREHLAAAQAEYNALVDILRQLMDYWDKRF